MAKVGKYNIHGSYGYTPPKSNIDTKNDGLENVCPFKRGDFGIFWVSMLDFRGVCISYFPPLS